MFVGPIGLCIALMSLGPLPGELTNISSLRWLDLSDNDLSGEYRCRGRTSTVMRPFLRRGITMTCMTKTSLKDASHGTQHFTVVAYITTRKVQDIQGFRVQG